jgi:hypothetical protein
MLDGRLAGVSVLSGELVPCRLVCRLVCLLHLEEHWSCLVTSVKLRVYTQDENRID